jgi:hypothetical protein
MTYIKSYDTESEPSDEDRIFCASFALIKVTRCLYEALDSFSASLAGSSEECFWWTQYQQRFEEQEYYREMLPEEISEALIAYAKNKPISSVNTYDLTGNSNLQKVSE